MPTPLEPSPLEQYIAPAGERHGLWRLVAGVVLILAGWFLWTVLVMAAYVLYRMVTDPPMERALEALGELVNAGGPASVLFQLTTFAGIWPATWAVLKLLHRQRFATLFSPEGGVRWRDFLGGLVLAAAFSAATLTAALVTVGMPERTELAAETWLMWLVPLALLVFLQASGEEMIFRGYMLQRLAARFRAPLIWAGAPALLFGFAHYSGGDKLGISWHYVVVTAAFGLAAAALVWRTGSLAVAMGLHTGMNLFAIAGLGVKGVLEGTQLFLYEESKAALLFTVDGIATLVILAFVLSPLCPFGARRAAA
ncbi:MAG TPA: CPBP family intramembrane glutamic endopeptidase [Thermohalobaculum sp.]|nr:CPBP family intramembrane glutamic endopeptidase [Thermohalobaculum sp.]